ncbi:MAG: hypothetical protein ACYTFQ_31090 [Planctomycetota bacterium]|jgi:hypothetical protein
MTIGAEYLLKEYGSVLGVAKAYIQGEVDDLYQCHVSEICGRVDIAAAEAALRLERSN